MNSQKRKKKLSSYFEKSPQGRWISSAVLAFGIVCALPVFWITESGTWYTNSVISLLLWGILTAALQQIQKESFAPGAGKWFLPAVWGFLFSICMAFGADLEAAGSVRYQDAGMWLGILIMSVGAAVFVRYSWDKLAQGILCQKQESNKTQGSDKSAFAVCDFFLRMLVIILCYLPVFLAVYPGFFVYDAQTEIVQIMTRNFTTQHPIFHVLFMGGIVQLFAKISGSYNVGIACYTVIQMVILSGVFSFVIGLLQKEGLKKIPRVLLTLYYGLFPVVVMFALCSTKDGLFMGAVLLLVVMVRELVFDGAAFFQKKTHVLLLTGSAVGVMLLRHNGYYAWLVFGVLLLLLAQKAGLGKQIVKTGILFVGTIGAYLLIHQGLIYGFRAVDIGSQEMLTVPIQQLARVYILYEEELGAEEKQTLYEILPKEVLEHYNPKLSDAVKASFQNENYHTDAAKYQKLWLKLGSRYPLEYFNAWMMTSYGFWYPDAVIDVYRGNSAFTFVYEDSSYFGYEVEQPGTRESKLPILDECYRRLSLEITQQKVPILSMLFSPGFLFWVFAYLICFMWYLGKIKALIPYLLPGLIWLTFLLGPTYLVRYVVYLWCLLPIGIYDGCLIIRNNCDILTKANCEETS